METLRYDIYTFMWTYQIQISLLFLQRYMRTLIAPAFSRVGFEEKDNDEHLDAFQRSQLVRWACSLKLAECTEEAKTSYQKWMDQLDPDQDGANP